VGAVPAHRDGPRADLGAGVRRERERRRGRARARDGGRRVRRRSAARRIP